MKNKGFTLIELIVVVSVIAILAGIIVPTVGSLVDEAKDSKMIAEVKNLGTAILQYEKNVGYMPYSGLPGGSANYSYAYYQSQTDQLNNLVVSYVSRRIRTDPWNNPYKYHNYSSWNPPARGVCLSFGKNNYTSLWDGNIWINRTEVAIANGYYFVFK